MLSIQCRITQIQQLGWASQILSVSLRAMWSTGLQTLILYKMLDIDHYMLGQGCNDQCTRISVEHHTHPFSAEILHFSPWTIHDSRNGQVMLSKRQPFSIDWKYLCPFLVLLSVCILTCAVLLLHARRINGWSNQCRNSLIKSSNTVSIHKR